MRSRKQTNILRNRFRRRTMATPAHSPDIQKNHFILELKYRDRKSFATRERVYKNWNSRKSNPFITMAPRVSGLEITDLRLISLIITNIKLVRLNCTVLRVKGLDYIDGIVGHNNVC